MGRKFRCFLMQSNFLTDFSKQYFSGNAMLARVSEDFSADYLLFPGRIFNLKLVGIKG